MLDFKSFSEGDWAIFQGAERFSDGSDPFIAEISVDGAEGFCTVDNNGIQVSFTTDEGEGDDVVFFLEFVPDQLQRHQVTTTVKRVARTLTTLTERTTVEELTKLGFEKIS